MMGNSSNMSASVVPAPYTEAITLGQLDADVMSATTTLASGQTTPGLEPGTGAAAQYAVLKALTPAKVQLPQHPPDVLYAAPTALRGHCTSGSWHQFRSHA